MSNNIEGKVVVITGASSGLGEASARYLSTQGATVVLAARRHDRIESLARELTARGGKATRIFFSTGRSRATWVVFWKWLTRAFMSIGAR